MSDRQEHEDTERTVDRRRLLRRAGTVAAGVAGAGVATAVAAAPAQAAPGDAVLQGRANNVGTADTTSITNNSPTNATLALGNSSLDADGGAGPALQLNPAGAGLSATAPVGAISADENGVLWTSVEFGGFPFQAYLYSSAISTVTEPLNSPVRALDTRSAAGRGNLISPGGNLDSAGRVLAGRTVNLNLGGLVDTGTAVLGNISIVSPVSGTFASVFPYNTPRPVASNINFNANQTLSNFCFCGIGFDPNDLDPNDAISIYVNTTAHVIFDVVAFVVNHPGQVLANSGASALRATNARAVRQSKAVQRAQLRASK